MTKMFEERTNIFERITKLEDLKCKFEELREIDSQSMEDLEKQVQEKKAGKHFSKASEQQLLQYKNSLDMISQVIDSIDTVINLLNNIDAKQRIQFDLAELEESVRGLAQQFRVVVTRELGPLKKLDAVMEGINGINTVLSDALEKAQEPFKLVDSRAQIRRQAAWNEEMESKLEKHLGPKLNKDQIDYVKRKLRETIKDQKILEGGDE